MAKGRQTAGVSALILFIAFLPSSLMERREETQLRLKPTTRWHRVHRASEVSCNMVSLHRVTDVEIHRRWAEWHAPATRSCSGRQTSVQWRRPHECLVEARPGDRGRHCSLWSPPSWVNLQAANQHSSFTVYTDLQISPTENSHSPFSRQLADY